MTRRRLLVIAVVMAIVIVAARFTVFRDRGEAFIAEAPMADGVHRVQLVAMAPEGPLDYDWKDPRPRFVAHFFPPSLFGGHVPFMPVHLDGLTRMESLPGASFVFRMVDDRRHYQQKNVELEFEESTGHRFPAGFMGTPDFSFFGTSAFTVSALPRRDKTLKMRLWETGQRGKSEPAVIEIPNPLYREPVDEWTPAPLPATQKVGNVKVELRRLIHSSGFLGFHTDCQLTKTDGTEDSPLTYQCTLEDATGNVGGNLSPFEPCWKVRIQIEPDPKTDFPADEIWRSETLPMPKAPEIAAVQKTITIQGQQLKLIALSAGGLIRISDGQLSGAPLSGKDNEGMTWTSRGPNVMEVASLSPFFLLSHAPIDRGTTVIVRLRIGDETLVGNQSSSTVNNQMFTSVMFPRWPAESTEGTLEIVVTKPASAEFFVAPPEEFREASTKRASE
jgi:hypothetical protein